MIQNENNRAQMVKTRMLREYNIKVIDKWLAECVSFYMQENPKISNEALFQFAFSQWLLADLNEIGIAVLPAGMDVKVEQHTLNGSFPVQMQYLIDISEPAYDQWRALYDKKMDEADDEVQMRKNQAPNVKKRRMLKLELTDGKQTVLAMEHSPINCLNTKLTPGLKLLLTGPMRCVNKVIFLEPRNVRVLGGEVDVLLITNAYENVLLRALNKPANPVPKLDYEEIEVLEGRNRPNHRTIPSIPMPQNAACPERKGNQRKSPAVAEDDDVDDSLLMGIDLDVIEATQPKPDQVPTISTLIDDDDMDDFVQLVDVRNEPEIMHQQVSSTKLSQSSPVEREITTASIRTKPTFDGLIEDDDIDVMNSLENEIRNEMRTLETRPVPDESPNEIDPPKAKKPRPSDEYRPAQQDETPRDSLIARLPTASCKDYSSNVRKEHTEPQPSTSKKFNQFNTSNLFEDSMDCTDEVGFAGEPTMFKILSPNYKYRIDGTSLVTIEQIMSLPEAYRADTSFVVYCEVESVPEQPRIRKEQWHLSIALTDHSNVCLPVRLHDSVISKMTRHDAAELMQMRKTDREGVMKLLESILQDFKELLQEIKCFWRIVYQADRESSEPPVVIETYEMNEQRGAILLDKIIQENCSQLRKML
ncbi:recQ-mediated genome instability protein 1-like [Anopheles moucheti]|uniref:recQ-mediated genome instability protein 1-like n=1 Tax=Anopheles moucheti TaxID=186751 RepID=UPI0022EFFB7B|nr:recQ-mediated genome instability protein 1-like [Anopheles moucheti]